MEKLNMRSSSSQAKSLGTIISVSRAFIVTLYIGQPIIISLPPSTSPQLLHFFLLPQPNWVHRGIIFVVVYLLAAIWNILQAATFKEYPSKMTVVLFSCFFGTLQCVVFSLIADRDPIAWRINPYIELAAILYSVRCVCDICIHTWAQHKKGPIYVTIFRPLGIVIAVVMSVSFLGDTLYAGR
ncbi:hypothetical protein GIB67_021187 [Kingdonia uniflora]|uniref:WAT1-related protein n=1 Tax=Kingdonia uniflora TaxID=39325 RepID=A0A7J7LFC9_9MAGN|nr:hypothetical protein GIB67_021187 [Kingdonia uniflora]